MYRFEDSQILQCHCLAAGFACYDMINYQAPFLLIIASRVDYYKYPASNEWTRGVYRCDGADTDVEVGVLQIGAEDVCRGWWGRGLDGY